MAYIKYKELTGYFNFSKKTPIEELPAFIEQYLEKDETVLLAYKVIVDQIVFTNKKIVLFDVKGLFANKRKIHILPYRSMSSIAMEFRKKSASLFLSMDSGYQLRFNFVAQNPEKKKELRIIFTQMAGLIGKNRG